MIIGPKYKIARRLGAGVFEKTQTQKFALSEGKRGKKDKRGGPKTDYGIQMLEKQKARFTYALTEKQFSNYVKKALAKKGTNQDTLYGLLESRLDNVVLRGGIGHTRLAARQIVSHGHMTVNGIRVTIPSYQVKVGDKIAIREASLKKPLFATLDERISKYQPPSWLKLDAEKKVIEVQGAPKLNTAELLFDIGQVLEFYSR
ncbi:30S ribosomal protein S4 [Patescibacteria group bacterium]|nr:30S ribosomal protein S4 [Patescibacteria group bacterium]